MNQSKTNSDNTDKQENEGSSTEENSESDKDEGLQQPPDDEEELSDVEEKAPVETGTSAKKKMAIIGGASLGGLIILTVTVILLLGSDDEKAEIANGIVKPPPGYLAGITIPPRKRKRMKSGLELSQERTNKINTSRPTLTSSNSQETSASEPLGATDKMAQGPSEAASSNGSLPTARVIGARTLPGKGLLMPSVTAAAYMAVPMKQKSGPVAAPDESLMETINDKVLPKVSTTGKGAWQTYNHPFSPNKQQIKTADGEKTIEKPYARVSIIIRGLGLNRNATLAAINKLPGAVSLAFSPYAKGLEEWTGLARGAGHETLISLPMEPADFPSSDPGPLSLLTDVNLEVNVDRLHSIMNLSQGNVGLIQYMGSRFVTSEAALKPIIKIIKDRGLLFVDDGLVKGALGVRLAADIFLPHVRCDMIIDDDASGVQVAQNLLLLEKLAKKNQSTLGLAKKNQSAIGIGEAYPATVMQIARWAKTLKAKLIDLAPVTAVVRDNFKPSNEGADAKT